MKDIVTVSATLDISNGCYMEGRVSPTSDVDFTLGTADGGVELIFNRYALERFVELAVRALDAPIPSDPKVPPTVLVSHGSEVRSAHLTEPRRA